MVLYQETQKISKTWQWLSLVVFIVCVAMSLLVNKVFVLGVILFGIFTVLLFQLKLCIAVYEDRIEYRLMPFHTSNKVVLMSSIVGIDTVRPTQLGISGFKIKNTSTGMYYYFGGESMVRIRTSNSRDLVLSVRGINEVQDVLKR